MTPLDEHPRPKPGARGDRTHRRTHREARREVHLLPVRHAQRARDGEGRAGRPRAPQPRAGRPVPRHGDRRPDQRSRRQADRRGCAARGVHAVPDWTRSPSCPGTTSRPVLLPPLPRPTGTTQGRRIRWTAAATSVARTRRSPSAPASNCVGHRAGDELDRRGRRGACRARRLARRTTSAPRADAPDLQAGDPYAQALGLDMIEGDYEDTGQLELNWMFDHADLTADRLVTYRQICRQVAARVRRHRLVHAQAGHRVMGNGCHHNVSLWRGDENVLVEPGRASCTSPRRPARPRRACSSTRRARWRSWARPSTPTSGTGTSASSRRPASTGASTTRRCSGAA